MHDNRPAMRQLISRSTAVMALAFFSLLNASHAGEPTLENLKQIALTQYERTGFISTHELATNANLQKVRAASSLMCHDIVPKLCRFSLEELIVFAAEIKQGREMAASLITKDPANADIERLFWQYNVFHRASSAHIQKMVGENTERLIEKIIEGTLVLVRLNKPISASERAFFEERAAKFPNDKRVRQILSEAKFE